MFTIILSAVFLVSRPLWDEQYGSRAVKDPTTGIVTEETVRNYKERSASWLVWYLGPVTPLLGLVGLVSAGYIVARRKNMLLLPGLIVVFSISFFFLFKPSIASDHVWASRRLLPVIIPGLLAFSIICLEYLHRQKKTTRLGVSGETISATLVTLMIVTPIFISWPFLRERTLVPQLSQWNEICASLPDKSAVIWIGEARRQAVQPTRTICDIPAVGLYTEPKAKELSMLAHNATEKGYTPIIGVFSSDTKLITGNTSAKMSVVSSIKTQRLNRAYLSPPRDLVESRTTVLLGIVEKNGTVSKIQ